MSTLLGVVGQVAGEMNSRSLAVYDDALVVVPGNTGQSLVRYMAVGAAAALGPFGAVLDAVADRGPDDVAPEPELLASSGPGRRLIPVSEVASARLGRSMAGLRRDLVLDLVTGERVHLQWPSLGPRSRDKLVVPMLRQALGGKLTS